MDSQQELNTDNKSGPVDETSSMAEYAGYEESFRVIKKGDYMMGKIVTIENDGIFVDVGYKTEGFVPTNQLTHRNIAHPSEVVNVGDEIPVVVLKSNDMEGQLILSKKRADLEHAWRNVTKAFETGEVVSATVVEAVRGGLLVDMGLRGFVPASQVDIRPVKDLQDYVGDSLDFRVIELDNARRKVVLSRKKVIMEEKAKQKDETLKSLYEGQILKGKVARLTDFGTFVNLGGVDGLVHISEMSWKRIKHPSEVLKVGDNVDVLVLKVDPKKERISLSIRQAIPDPWHSIDEDVQVGSMVKGRISKIAKKYVFVEIIEGVEGVIPMHELSEKRFARPQDVVREGQDIEVKVLELNRDARRMLLSLKQSLDSGSRKDIMEFTSNASSSSSSSGEAATIGDILKAKMKEKEAEETTQALESAESQPEAAPKKAPTPQPEPVVEEIAVSAPVKVIQNEVIIEETIEEKVPDAGEILTVEKEEPREEFLMEETMASRAAEEEIIEGMPTDTSISEEIVLKQVAPAREEKKPEVKTPEPVANIEPPPAEPEVKPVEPQKMEIQPPRVQEIKEPESPRPQRVMEVRMSPESVMGEIPGSRDKGPAKPTIEMISPDDLLSDD